MPLPITEVERELVHTRRVRYEGGCESKWYPEWHRKENSAA